MLTSVKVGRSVLSAIKDSPDVTKNKYADHCFECGNMGKRGEPCSQCGREYGIELASQEVTQEVGDIIPELELLMVPSDYWGLAWSAPILLQDHTILENDISFQRFINSMERFHTIFESGRLPSSSGIIMSPPRFSKRVLAYSCMQFALKHGYTVSPILDTCEVKRLLVMAGDNPRYKPMGLEYEKYITSDVVFITVQKDESKRFCTQTILSLFDKRSRHGKCTFLLSSYPYEDLREGDRNREFADLFKDHFKDNRKRIPAIIRYDERR